MCAENSDHTPKVSVIVPIYNVGKYLRQCLESLVNQTLEEIEFICVNDGSTDNSLDILEEYAQTDDRIKVISKANSGYGHSMNTGLSHAKGKYIGIVESDDFVCTDMFEQLYLRAEAEKVDAIKSNYYEYRKSEKKYIENLKNVSYNKVFSPEESLEIFHTAPSIWSGLYRTDFLRRYRITFHETPGASYQDVSFFFLVLLYAKRMICIPDAFLNYRIDNMDASRHSTNKVFCIMSEFERIQKRYMQEDKIELLKAIEAIKFREYCQNYNKINYMFQYAFLYEMSKEIVRDETDGLIDRKYWSNDEWDELQQIKNERDEYFQRTNIDYLKQYQLKDWTINHKIEIEAHKEAIKNASKVIIYGTGVYGEKISNEINRLNSIFAYAVTEQKEDSEKEINGIKVYEIRELLSYTEEALVVVAVNKTLQLPIITLLHELGFKQILYVNQSTLND